MCILQAVYFLMCSQPTQHRRPTRKKILRPILGKTQVYTKSSTKRESQEISGKISFVFYHDIIFFRCILPTQHRRSSWKKIWSLFHTFIYFFPKIQKCHFTKKNKNVWKRPNRIFSSTQRSFLWETTSEKKYAVEKVEKNIRRYFQYSLFSRVFETKITGKVRL